MRLESSKIVLYLFVHFWINLQLFDSVLKLSILVNVMRKNVRFAQYFRFFENCVKSPKTYCTSCAKDKQKFQNICEKIMQIVAKKYGHFVETLHSKEQNTVGWMSRGFNGSVNISECCDFRTQFDPLYITLLPFYLNHFLLVYTFWMNKYKINKSVSL